MIICIGQYAIENSSYTLLISLKKNEKQSVPWSV